jgi:hypothetical protein
MRRLRLHRPIGLTEPFLLQALVKGKQRKHIPGRLFITDGGHVPSM